MLDITLDHAGYVGGGLEYGPNFLRDSILELQDVNLVCAHLWGMRRVNCDT